MRDIFGRLSIAPGKLPREQRIDLLLGLAGRLLANKEADARWLGAALRDTLADGGDLLARLGVKPAWLATITLAGVLPHEGMLPVGLLSFLGSFLNLQ